MAYFDKNRLREAAQSLGPHYLEDKIRNDIAACWLLQDPANRNAGYIRDLITGILDKELKDIDNIVRGLI
jgi:hypothetical protein